MPAGWDAAYDAPCGDTLLFMLLLDDDGELRMAKKDPLPWQEWMGTMQIVTVGSFVPCPFSEEPFATPEEVEAFFEGRRGWSIARMDDNALTEVTAA